MAYEDGQRKERRAHTACLENRERLKLTGVCDVGGFDENTVLLATDMGELSVRGEGLHVERIDLTAGEIELRGRVQEMSYDEAADNRSFFGKLFG